MAAQSQPSVLDAGQQLATNAVTSRELTEQSLVRIRELDQTFNSIILTCPQAGTAADASDHRRRAGAPLGLLDGVTIAVKDNIDIEGLPTTAGSLALTENVAARDAPVVASLRQAGAVLVAKTNLSEWANIRSPASISGWSAVRGFTRNAHAPDRSPSGSSSGSAVAVALGYVSAAIGTETDGSIVWPAAINGIVGLKPTVGAVSRRGIIPISQTQDTPGPMTQTVKDAATLMSVIGGHEGKQDYFAKLSPQALKGARLGVMRFLQGFSPETWDLFDARLEVLRSLGATIIDVNDFDLQPILANRLPILLTEFKVGVNEYLGRAPDVVHVRTLADVIAFNRAEVRELAYFGQEFFELAEATRGIDDPTYRLMSTTSRRLAGPEGIDLLLKRHDITALIAPSNDPAWVIATDKGDMVTGSASTLPATAGYPHLTVPLGRINNLPIGMSFIGPAWSETTLLSYGYAYEQGQSAGAVGVPHNA